MRVAQKMLDIASRAGEKIIDAEHFGPIGEETFAQVRPQESSAAGHQDSFYKMLAHACFLAIGRPELFFARGPSNRLLCLQPIAWIPVVLKRNENIW